MISSQQQQQHHQQQQISEDDEEEETHSLGFCAFCLELVGGTSKKQNWKALGIAFLVIATICLFILLAILLTSTQQISLENQQQSIDDNDIAQIKYPQPWNGTWISEKTFTYIDTNNSIWLYDCDTLQYELLFNRDLIQKEFIDHAIVSPSTRYILIPFEKEKIRTYYTEYRYHLYERHQINNSIILRNEQKHPFSTIVYSHSDNLFAFIQNFNIYIFDLTTNVDSQITFDGHRDSIHNGLIEWHYEYEIFQRNQLLFWSIDDRYLAFIKINLTNLARNYYLKYDLLSSNEEKYSIPYPKLNQSIPHISAYVYDVKTRKTLRIPRPFEYEKSKKSYVYIYHFVWYSPTNFAVVYGNRRENSAVIQLYEIFNEKILVKSRFVDEARRGIVISRFLQPVFSPTGNEAYIIRFEQSNVNRLKAKTFPHVVRIQWNQGLPTINARSSDEINAHEIIHVDRWGWVYFTGSRRNDSLEKQLFRWNGLNLECLSCRQSCAYADAKFSLGDGFYYIFQCFGPSIPYSKLFNRTNELALIHDNELFRIWVEDRLMPYIGYFTVPLTSRNTGNGMIIFPPNYSPNRTIASYPVIVSINDRLNDQRVNKKYYFSLPEFIQVIEGNLTLVIFDSHGSAGQDEIFWKNNNQDWLDRQVEDYLKVARYLKWNETRFSPTLNQTRFGLRARGSAAMIALKLLEESQEYICAFLRSPVTDFNHYDAIFGERINALKLSKDRKENFGNRSLAIAHGTADEVVHFKHSASLVQSLINASIPVDFKVYPDVGHYFEHDRKVYNNFLHSERQFFHHCLGSRWNKERKIIISEEDYD